jgi:hypothetical protein
MGLKIARGVEIRILDQLYAGENMVGIRAGIHMDSNIIDQQKIAVLKYKA